jgi:hypothetical protein
MSAHVIRDSLKWKVKDCETVDALHRCAPRLLAAHRLVRGGDGGGGGSPDGGPDEARVALGRCIRELGAMWQAGCVLAALLPSPQAQLLGVEGAAEAGAEARAGASPELRSPVDGLGEVPEEESAAEIQIRRVASHGG